MIKAKSIEHYDHFGDSIVFWCEAEVDNEEFISKARDIDGENYNAECFGICIVFDENGFTVSSDSTFEEELFYTDVDGIKRYFRYRLTDEETKDFTWLCANKIHEMTKEK